MCLGAFLLFGSQCRHYEVMRVATEFSLQVDDVMALYKRTAQDDSPLNWFTTSDGDILQPSESFTEAKEDFFTRVKIWNKLSMCADSAGCFLNSKWENVCKIAFREQIRLAYLSEQIQLVDDFFYFGDDRFKNAFREYPALQQFVDACTSKIANKTEREEVEAVNEEIQKRIVKSWPVYVSRGIPAELDLITRNDLSKKLIGSDNIQKEFVVAQLQIVVKIDREVCSLVEDMAAAILKTNPGAEKRVKSWTVGSSTQQDSKRVLGAVCARSEETTWAGCGWESFKMRYEQATSVDDLSNANVIETVDRIVNSCKIETCKSAYSMKFSPHERDKGYSCTGLQQPNKLRMSIKYWPTDSTEWVPFGRLEIKITVGG